MTVLARHQNVYSIQDYNRFNVIGETPFFPVVSEEPTEDIPILERRVSRNFNERREAFKLVQRMYVRAGLTANDDKEMRVMKHHVLDTTDVMVSKRDEEVDFTVTLVRDGEFGLPAESLFGEEIQEMRSQGIKLAEISCVASGCDHLSKKDRVEKLISMVGLTFQVARRRGVERLVLAVHPHHAKVYRRMFGCVPCSDVRDYEFVQGNPAVLCTHDFAKLDEQKYSLYNQVYGSQYDPWELDGILMSDAEKIYFNNALTQDSDEFIPMAA